MNGHWTLFKILIICIFGLATIIVMPCLDLAHGRVAWRPLGLLPILKQTASQTTILRARAEVQANGTLPPPSLPGCIDHVAAEINQLYS